MIDVSRVSIGEKQLRPGWTLLLKNKFFKQDRPKRYIISPACSSILTLYHVLASGLLRSSSLVGKGRYNKVYNDDDELWLDGKFKSGKLWDGKLYKYDSDGILLKIEIWKEGKYHSDGQLR